MRQQEQRIQMKTSIKEKLWKLCRKLGTVEMTFLESFFVFFSFSLCSFALFLWCNSSKSSSFYNWHQCWQSIAKCMLITRKTHSSTYFRFVSRMLALEASSSAFCVLQFVTCVYYFTICVSFFPLVSLCIFGIRIEAVVRLSKHFTG